MRHLGLLALVFLSACSTAPVQGPGPTPSAPNAGEYDQLVVVGTNDFHGYLRTVESDLAGSRVLIGGAEWFAGYVNILKEKFGDSLILLDGGDMFQGTIDSNMFHGKSVVDFYNLLPYRAVAVGNHEFDYGPEKRNGHDHLGAIKARMMEAKYPFVQANIYWRKTGEPWREKNLQPSVIVKAGGYKVGIIGLTTTSTPGKTLPVNVEPLEFRDFVQPTLEEARNLREQGADFVMITTHEGGENKGEPIYELLHSIPKGTIDAVVSGHAHSEIHQLVNGVPVIQSKTRGLFFGRIDLYVNKQTRRIETARTVIHNMHSICGTWFRTVEGCDQKAAKDSIAAGKAKVDDFLPLRASRYEGQDVQLDANVRAVLQPYFAKADKKRSEVFGVAKADFDWYTTGENQMGTLILDAFHWRFPEAKVIVMNGGGIRRRIFKGKITYGDLYEVSPFDNYAVTMKMKGWQLKEMVRALTAGSTQVPAVWGIKVKFTDRDSGEFDQDVNGDGKKDRWERNRLDPHEGVVWEKTGKPVKDDEEFEMATIDYLAAGGDNVGKAFKDIPESKRKYYQQGPRDLMADYLRKHRGIQLPRQGEMRLTPVK